MRKFSRGALCFLALFVFVFAGAFVGSGSGSGSAFAGARIEVRLAPVGRSPAFAQPRLGRNQGWLTITNRDWKPYTINILREGRMALVEGALPSASGTVVRSGGTVTLALARDNWEIVGSSGDELRVRVREGRISTVSLEPFGYVNNTGLRGVVDDGGQPRSKVLIESYAPPPAVIVRPIPPPVIITPPRRPSIHRPPAVPGRRPTPPPPPARGNDRNDRNNHNDRDDRGGRDNNRDRNDRDRGNDRDRDRDGFGFNINLNSR